MRGMDSAEFSYLASPITGGGVRVDRATQLYLFAQQRGLPDAAEMLATHARDAVTPDRNGEPSSGQAAREFAQKQIARIETHVVPMLRKLGIV